jgi:hypothetical protein
MVNRCDISACCGGAYRRVMATFAVLTYSKNGATFPNDGMGSPFCKPNEIIQNEGWKKNRYLTQEEGARRAGSGKQEAGDRPGDH